MATGYGDGYGVTPPGYGDPNLTYAVVVPGDQVVPDDGGVVVNLTGNFPRDAYNVRVGGSEAYSGRSGGGPVCRPNLDRDRLAFVVPAGLPLGPADLVLTSADGAVTLTGALTVVRRHRRLLTYALNDYASPLGPHPARGPVAPDGDAIDAPGQVYRPRRAVLDALGQSLNEIGGMLLTRLTAELPPAFEGLDPVPPEALALQVETTFGFPPQGDLYLGGELVTYTGLTATSFTGCTRDPFRYEAHRAGEIVALYAGRGRGAYSALDLTRDALFVDSAAGTALDILGRNHGVNRPEGADDEFYRELIRLLAYQPGRGTRGAIADYLDVATRACKLVFPEAAYDAVSRTLSVSGADFGPTWHQVRIRLYASGAGQGAPVATLMVLGPTGPTVLAIDPRGGIDHQPAGAAPSGTYTAVTVPYDILEPVHRPGVVVVRLRCPAPSIAGKGYIHGTRWLDSTDADTVEVEHPIRQVLGVWLAEDRARSGTNFATTNTFSGAQVDLDAALPDAVTAVQVQYGVVVTPSTAPTTGLPGSAPPPATGQLLRRGQRNDGSRFPIYLGPREQGIRSALSDLTVAGVIGEVVESWL